MPERGAGLRAARLPVHPARAARGAGGGRGRRARGAARPHPPRPPSRAAGRPHPLTPAADRRGELPAHTTASDGRATLEEMAFAARERGFEYLAITDHSATHGFGNEVSPDQLKTQIEKVHALNERLEGIELLAGSE